MPKQSDPPVHDPVPAAQYERVRPSVEPARPPGQPGAASQSPADQSAADVDPDPTPAMETFGPQSQRGKDAQIGPYQIISTLGEGGMGTVYLARQSEPVERVVALKLIRGSLAGPTALSRFAAERQALARLSHVNVAQMFEAGTTDDFCPYFAMEHVDGIPITDYCDQHQLSIESRLELFIGVCAGVQHAHQRGIIHRDLKPSNILVHEVDGVPIPKVIDFGIAKALDGSLSGGRQLTGTGMVGTPSYMSPESFHFDGEILDVDTRTDVYALGVLLYELIAGVRPFERRDISLSQLLKVITETDARKASTCFLSETLAQRNVIAAHRATSADELLRRLRLDLDWIAAQALARQRDERYASVSDLAADVGRHLANQPVLASPPSLGYRTRKFVRRHRAGVAIAATGLLLLIAFVTTLILQTARIAAERDRANRESAARGAVSEFLTDLFKVSDPSEARGNSITARELLDRGAQKIESELADQPVIQAELMETIGVIYRELALYKQAQPLIEAALATRIQLFGETHRDTLRAKMNQASIFNKQQRFAEAGALYESIAVTAKKTLPDEDPLFAEIMLELGSTYMFEADYEQAERVLLDSVERFRRVKGDQPDDYRAQLELTKLYLYQSHYDEAQTRYREILAQSTQSLGGDHPQTLLAMDGLAGAYFFQGDYEHAVEIYQQLLLTNQRIFGPDHPRPITTSLNLAAALELAGNWEEALALYEHTDTVAKRALGPDSGATLMNANNLADLYTSRGRYEDAKRLRLEVIESRMRVLGSEHSQTLESKFGLANLYALQGKYLLAVSALEEHLSAHERIFGPTDRVTLASRATLAQVYMELGRGDASEALYRRSWQLNQETFGDEHRHTLLSMQQLATLLMKRGQFDEAQSLQREVLALRQRVLGAEDLDTVSSTSALGALLVQVGHCDAALPLLKQSYASASKLKSNVKSALAIFHYNLASYAAACGKPTDALIELQAVRDLGWKSNWIRSDPALEPLRHSAEFRLLADAIGGEQE
jgi:non-specific serine/threonine protein kinase/serine/threonine-protein kinase